MLSVPPAVRREDTTRGETSKPLPARRPESTGPGPSGRINGTVAPQRTVAAASDAYLAPALRAAAAARDHTARIRAEQRRPVPPGLTERVPEGAAALPGEPQRQPWRSGAEPAAAAAIAPEARGLSVAAAAQASTIAFRPLRNSAPVLRAADPSGAPAATAAAPPPPVEILPRPLSRRVEPQRRFAKTLAAVERYREVTQGDEPGAHIVPSPVLARPDQGETVGTPWTRLWARRKGSATE